MTYTEEEKPYMITNAELQTRWAVSKDTIQRMRKQGKIIGFKIGKQVRFQLAEIERVEQLCAQQ